MKVIRLVSKKYFSSNTYIVIKSNHALIIDLGFYDEEFSSILSDYKIDGVILTHKHFDHIQGLKEFQNEYSDVNIYTKENSSDFFMDSKLNCSFNMSSNGELNYMPKNIVFLKEENIKVGIFDLKILFTPGHSIDSICIILEEENIFFSGDFIFNNSIGRMDLPTSNRMSMFNSLTKITPILKRKNYLIYSGHDEEMITSELLFKENAYLKRFY